MSNKIITLSQLKTYDTNIKDLIDTKIDSRFVVQSESDLENIRVYEGLEVYIKDLKIKKLYDGTEWVEIISGSKEEIISIIEEIGSETSEAELLEVDTECSIATSSNYNVTSDTQILTAKAVKAIVDNGDNQLSESIQQLLNAKANTADVYTKSEIDNRGYATQSQLHSHSNKDVLDATTAPFTAELLVKLNGVDGLLANKANSADVYTKSESDNNYVSKTHLTDSYYNKTTIDEMIRNISTIEFKIANGLPTENISTSTIYLVPYENEYEEYIYINNKWEMLGTTKINIDEYATKAYVDDMINSKIDSSITAALEADY